MQPGSNTTSAPSTNDRGWLKGWRQGSRGELRPLLERYGPMVYASAYRRAGDSEKAAEIARTVFLVLSRRARKLPKKTVLAGWLFQVTALACRKTLSKPQRLPWWRFVWRRPKAESPSDATLWGRVSPRIDAAILDLPVRTRNALLLQVFLNLDWECVADTLGTHAVQARKRVHHALEKLTRRLRKQGVLVEIETLREICFDQGCKPAVPEGLVGSIVESIEANLGKKLTCRPARRTLTSLVWAQWRRRLTIAIPTSLVALALLGVIIWHLSARSGHSRLISEFVYWKMSHGMGTMIGPAESIRPWPINANQALRDASALHNSGDLYRTTNVWLVHLGFTREQWKALEPKRIGPMPNFAREDGLWILRNPLAHRSGLLGVLGFEHGWTQAAFEFGNLGFTNVAVRVKGNIGSLCREKRPFKVDLNKFSKGQKLVGVDELTFNNLIWDYSCLHDALGYEFFRDAGVPAPRTAYAWLSATVESLWTRKPLGLYLMLESVDGSFAAERFGSKKTALFKPVSYNLFEYLGNDWAAYAEIYDPKTRTSEEQHRRIIEFARLVSVASDTEFAAEVGGFLDLDAFARFLASQVLLSNYDGILADGQNFYMYLDPRSNKLGFIPWDLDSAWGAFWLGSREQMERASIWHPWVGRNRFIERVMSVKEFREMYRACLEGLLANVFVPDRLQRRIDKLAAVLHEPIGAESSFRLNKFEQSVGMQPVQSSPDEAAFGPNRPAYELKRFIQGRAKSVRRQLDGQSRGMILRTPAEK